MARSSVVVALLLVGIALSSAADIPATKPAARPIHKPVDAKRPSLLRRFLGQRQWGGGFGGQFPADITTGANMDMMHGQIDMAAGANGLGGAYTSGVAAAAPYNIRMAQIGYPGSIWNGRRLRSVVATKTQDAKPSLLRRFLGQRQWGGGFGGQFPADITTGANMDMMHGQIDVAAGANGLGGAYTSGVAAAAPYNIRMAQIGYPGSIWNGRRLQSDNKQEPKIQEQQPAAKSAERKLMGAKGAQSGMGASSRMWSGDDTMAADFSMMNTQANIMRAADSYDGYTTAAVTQRAAWNARAATYGWADPSIYGRKLMSVGRSLKGSLKTAATKQWGGWGGNDWTVTPTSSSIPTSFQRWGDGDADDYPRRGYGGGYGGFGGGYERGYPNYYNNGYNNGGIVPGLGLGGSGFGLWIGRRH